jgi:trans-2,3-dihydro-3-hydroxyanthranilate isomerase
VNTARLRIFTPFAELPFAGHPTIGAAVLIAQLRAGDLMAREDLGLVLEEEIGAVSCTARQLKGRPAQASFVLPRLPEALCDSLSVDALAAALSLAPEDIGFDQHRPSLWSAGVGFTFVPIKSREAIARARPALEHWSAIGPAELPKVFLYTKEVTHEGRHVHARMFAPTLGVAEDPATGSAAAAFAGPAVTFERPEDGEHSILIEQGEEIGRPSLIQLTMEIAGGALVRASIGGSAVRVMQGVLDA